MVTKWQVFGIRNCLLFICVLLGILTETLESKLGKDRRIDPLTIKEEYGTRDVIGKSRTSGSFPAQRFRRGIKRGKFVKGDLCNEDPSNCQFHSEPPNHFYANILRTGRSKNRFYRKLRDEYRPIYRVERIPVYEYPPPYKSGRVDAMDVFEHLLVKGMEYTGMIKPKKKKKLTLGKGNRPYVWNEAEDSDIDPDEPNSDLYPSLSPYKPTGNIYYAGNKFYSGSHDHINLLKKYGVDKWKRSKYHLKPLVNFESPDDYDDLWDREYEDTWFK